MNGKGGVGKTSLVANLAGVAAAGGWRVLAVDVDPQGNLARDLGVLEPSDAGRNLRAAAVRDELLQPLREVRPNLDVVPGGEELDGLLADIQASVARGRYRSATAVIEHALAPIAGDYDLVVVDSPPGEKALQTAAARAAHFIVIPACPDDCSIDGLGAVYDRYWTLRSEGANDDLRILGVALTLLPAGATTIAARARRTLTDLLGQHTAVFDATIRFAQAAAVDCRRLGLTAVEYADAAASAAPWYADRTADRYSRAAHSLAEDYRSLVGEVLHAYTRAGEVADADRLTMAR